MMKKLYLISLLFLVTNFTLAQGNDSQIGTPNAGLTNWQGNLFDYSDPQAINIKVSVWGFVRSPGRYIIPSYTTVTDLLSFAGGPTDGSDLEDLRIYRMLEDGSQQLIKFDYNDLMWENKLSTKSRFIPNLQASDILIVPGAPRLYFRDWFGIGISIFSALISLSILIINIVR
jgi:hypothetical protein